MSSDAVVVIPWRGGNRHRERNLGAVLTALSQALPGVPILTVDSGHETFNRAASRNDGVQRAATLGARTVIVNDADTIAEPEPLRASLSGCKDGNLHLPYTECVIRSRNGETRETVPNSTGGVVVLECQTWNHLGGQDEKFHGWGFEDIAFRVAADTFAGVVRHPGTITHLWHPSDRDANSASYQAGLALCDEYTNARHNPDAVRELQGPASPIANDHT